MLHSSESTKEIKSNKLKFNIPPSKVSALSSQTMTLLKDLKDQNDLKPKSPKSTQKTLDEILNSVPAREKYQDLLDPVLQLSLPYKYKRLLKLQNRLDSLLNYTRNKNEALNFNCLKEAIEVTYRQCLETEHLQKILFLCPDFYKVKWNAEQQLEIDLPDESSYSLSVLHNRSCILKEEMLKRVKNFHKTHLERSGISFDPDVFRTWHSSFALHEVEDIPNADLPHQTENKVSVNPGSGYRQRLHRLSSSCELIYKIFSNHTIPSLFMNSLVKKVQEEKQQDEDGKFIKDDIVEISRIFPDWLSIIETQSGDVVRLNKTVEFSKKSFVKKLNEKYLVN